MNIFVHNLAVHTMPLKFIFIICLIFLPHWKCHIRSWNNGMRCMSFYVFMYMVHTIDMPHHLVSNKNQQAGITSLLPCLINFVLVISVKVWCHAYNMGYFKYHSYFDSPLSEHVSYEVVLLEIICVTHRAWTTQLTVCKQHFQMNCIERDSCRLIEGWETSNRPLLEHLPWLICDLSWKWKL